MLRETIRRRMGEFRYPTFSPFGLEMICFDLRKRRKHDLTLDFAGDSPAGQEAVDRELVRQYRPGTNRCGPLMQALFPEIPDFGCAQPRGSFASFQSEVQCPARLNPCIEERWRELGYRGFSAYVTGLLRYDLSLLGPHIYFNGDDKDPEILAALDADTEREFRMHKPQRHYLHQMLEMAEGRKLTDEERASVLRWTAGKIREKAMNPRARNGDFSREERLINAPERTASIGRRTVPMSREATEWKLKMSDNFL